MGTTNPKDVTFHLTSVKGRYMVEYLDMNLGLVAKVSSHKTVTPRGQHLTLSDWQHEFSRNTFATRKDAANHLVATYNDYVATGMSDAHWFDGRIGVSPPSEPEEEEIEEALAEPWVTYHSDRSGATVWSSEVEALRHAVQNSCSAKKIVYGEDIFA